MRKPMTGGAEIGILNIDFNECGCFLCSPHDGFGKIIIVNISLDQAGIQLSHRVYCHQDGGYVDMELSENYQKYIDDLRENFNSLLLTQPNFQTSRKEKYAVYKRYIMQCPKITMLSGDGACVKEFRTNFSHVKLEETEIPIEGGEVVVDDTRKVILITPNQNVHSFGSRYLDYPMKDGSLQNISKKRHT